ncbi:MAG: hypothetical protein ACUVTL_06790 [Thermoproteota archaeon]
MSLPSPLEKELYITLLTLKSEKIDLDTISQRIGLTHEKIKEHLQGLCNVEIRNEVIIIDDATWVSLLENAIRKGILLYEVASKISWQRFEFLTEEALIRHDFKTRRNIRFRSESRRWEIDVVGVRGDDLICFDCKQWKTHRNASLLKRSAVDQVNRVAALAQFQTKPINQAERSLIKMYPAMITLLDFDRYIVEGCFVVPILKLNNFLDRFYELRDLIQPIKAKIS